MVSVFAESGHSPDNDERAAMEGGPGIIAKRIVTAWMPGRLIDIGV